MDEDLVLKFNCRLIYGIPVLENTSPKPKRFNGCCELITRAAERGGVGATY